MQNTCLQCKKVYETKRVSLYCSAVCRVTNSRNKITRNKPVTDKSVTDNVTDNFLEFGLGQDGSSLVYCTPHSEHVRVPYCQDVCVSCVHILEESVKE